MIEKQINEKLIFSGKIFDAYIDDVLVDEKMTTREYIKHKGGSAILLVDGDYTYLVKQYRYAVQKDLLEIPAGKLETGEDPLNTAVREGVEETGLLALNPKLLGSFYPTVGYSNEEIFLYYATELEISKQNLDDGEHLDIIKIKLDEVYKMIENNQIKDGKTIMAFMLYKNIL